MVLTLIFYVMKKYFLMALFALGTIGFAASCEDETAEETTELHSPDKDKVCPPGANCE